MTEPDEALIGRVAAGDREAFAALYRRRRPDVYRFALHMTGSHPLAEDVAQDVFMAVIADAARFVPGRATVVAWLLGIARNYVRRRQAERRYEELPQGAREPRAAQDLTGPLEAAQGAARLRQALATLPEHYRTAVVLCDLQELSYEEAAAAAGCALGTIRSRVHRGRSLLSERLRGDRGAWAGWPAVECL